MCATHTDARSDDADDDSDSPTDRTHDTSWSVNLEKPEHEADRDRVVEEALDAVERTAAGTHVNLVTHGAHGHPRSYLYDALTSAETADIDWEYVDQCGCGGHVTRVWVR